MRIQKSENGFIAQAIAGTHVVFLGWDIGLEIPQADLLGFAIQRTDHMENEVYWLRSTKVFEGTAPLAKGQGASKVTPIHISRSSGVIPPQKRTSHTRTN